MSAIRSFYYVTLCLAIGFLFTSTAIALAAMSAPPTVTLKKDERVIAAAQQACRDIVETMKADKTPAISCVVIPTIVSIDIEIHTTPDDAKDQCPKIAKTIADLSPEISGKWFLLGMVQSQTSNRMAACRIL